MGDLINDLFALQAAIAHAGRTREWIVVVVPTADGVSGRVAQTLVTLLPPEASICGRTALLPGGGRVTVIGGSQPLHGDGFRVMFLGFDGKLMPADEIAVHAWTQAARGVVTLGDHAGELRVH